MNSWPCVRLGMFREFSNYSVINFKDPDYLNNYNCKRWVRLGEYFNKSTNNYERDNTRELPTSNRPIE